MKSYKNNAQFTSTVHSMVKQKTQGILWDLIMWLESDCEVQSVRDLLSYIRLFSDFGDAAQGRIFLSMIRDNKALRLILPEIAERFVQRGKSTGSVWLEELGLHIQHLHSIEPHPGVGHERVDQLSQS